MFGLLKNNLSPFVCVISALVCIISAVSIIFVKKEPMDVDWVSVLVGILSFLVTVLAILQAVNYIWFEKKMRISLNKLESQLRNDFHRSEDDLRIAVRAYYLMLNSSESYVASFRSKIQGILDALLEDSKSNGHIATKDILNDLYDLIKNVHDSDKYIDTTKKLKYIATLQGIDDERITEICEFVLSCNDIGELEK